jgi:hypothetical protein
VGGAARAIGERPSLIRYATLTGRVAIRWDGARAPAIWTLPRRKGIGGRRSEHVQIVGGHRGRRTDTPRSRRCDAH